MSNVTNDSINKKKGLGRGLGSLLGGTSEALDNQIIQNSQIQAKANSLSTAPTVTINPEEKIWKVGIEKLSPGKYQPRKSFTKEALQELANSIKENDILQPIVVRRTLAGKMEIVAGERRWRAAQIAGKHEVPVIIKDIEDKEALELAIIENVQREGLNPIEEAEGYNRLATEFKLSQQQIAERVGKERATVANAMRLLLLPEQIKEHIINGEISAGHAKVLLTLQSPEEQKSLSKKVIHDKMSVRKLEQLIQKAKKEKESNALTEELNANITVRLIDGLSEELQKMLGTKVTIDYSNSKGKISIHYYSDEELTQLVDKLKQGCQN